MSRSIAVLAAEALQITPDRVVAVARSASTRYRRYALTTGTTGKVRWIHHPDPELKTIQRWLARCLFSHLPVHDAAFAYRPGRSIADHARVHASRKYILRLDLRGFFPSIYDDDIQRFFSSPAAMQSLTLAIKGQLPIDDIALITDLCCRHGRLTIGAPTSPSLSNAICYQLDKRLEALMPADRVCYSRYCDDLYFSCNESDVLTEMPHRVSAVLGELESPARLYLNVKKTRHMSRKRRRTVTGLIITPEGSVSVGRQRRRQVRAAIHNIEKLAKEDRLSLAGTLAYVQNVEPEYLARLYAQFGAATIDRARYPTREQRASNASA